MMFVTKKALRRRTFLRGVGATVSLPLLDAMIPALSAKPLKSTPRLGFIYIANGVIQDQWIPKTTGPNFALSPILQPLEPVQIGAHDLAAPDRTIATVAGPVGCHADQRPGTCSAMPNPTSAMPPISTIEPWPRRRARPNASS